MKDRYKDRYIKLVSGIKVKVTSNSGKVKDTSNSGGINVENMDLKSKVARVIQSKLQEKPLEPTKKPLEPTSSLFM